MYKEKFLLKGCMKCGGAVELIFNIYEKALNGAASYVISLDDENSGCINCGCSPLAEYVADAITRLQKTYPSADGSKRNIL